MRRGIAAIFRSIPWRCVERPNSARWRVEVVEGSSFGPRPDLHYSETRGGTVHDFADRALGLGDGSPRFESFTGDTVDCARAFTSIIHSAFLVLYHEGEREAFERKFDAVRVLLKKAVDGMLTNADYEVIREMVQISIALPRERFGDKAVSVNDYRTLYDPSFDFGDGLLEDFPKKCISYGESQWVVTLPYSRSLQAKICFDR